MKPQKKVYPVDCTTNYLQTSKAIFFMMFCSMNVQI